MTVPIVSRPAPIPTPFDCGICNVDHACHCPRMKAYCDACPPLGVSSDGYQAVTGLTMTGKVAATAYRRRQNLRAVS